MLVQVDSGNSRTGIHLVDARSSQWLRLSSNRFTKQGPFWIPQGGSRELRFYMDSFFVPQSFQQLLRREMARHLSDKSPASFLPQQKTSTLEEILQTDLLEAASEALDTERFFKRSLVSMLVTGEANGFKRDQKGLLLFGRGSSPFAAVRVSPESKPASQTLKQEFDVVRRLKKHFPQSAKPFLPPHPLLRECGGFTFLAHPFMPGRSVFYELRNAWRPRQNAAHHLSAGLDWLMRFQRAAWIESVELRREPVISYISGILSELRRATPLSPREKIMIDYLGKLAWELKLERIPLSVSHGNFWPRNMIWREGQLHVLGWEDFSTLSLPFKDLFLLPLSYGLSFPWKRGQWVHPVSAFAFTFLERNWFSRLAQDYFATYCRKMNLDARLLDLFLPLFLTEQFIQEKKKGAGGEPFLWRDFIREYAERGGCALL
jgi:hypothetical protein